jgi:hypothetical protein
MPLSPSRAV